MAAERAPRREAATGPYTGRLVDPLGRPMQDVEITLQSWEEALQGSSGGMAFTMGRKRKPPTGTTNKEGRFSIPAKSSLGRSLGAKVVIPGYSKDPIKCVLDPDEGRELGDVAIEPAVQISGWVRDDRERGVPGARVRRVARIGDGAAEVMKQIGFGGLVESVTTDADGYFEMLHEDEGAITLAIESDEILEKRWDGPTRRAGEVLQDIVISVERAGTIEGVVVGYPRGRKRGMVAAVALDPDDEDEFSTGLSEMMAAQLAPAGDHTAPIESDGSFKLTGLVPGSRYEISAISKSFIINTVKLSESIEARSGDKTANLNFQPGATVTFQAVDEKTGRPIEELTVSGRYASDPAYVQLSENAGDPPDRFPGGKVTLYELRPDTAPKTLSLKIDAPGYFRRSDVTVDVPESGTVNLGKVALKKAPELRFRVVDAANGKPIKRARITLEPANAPSLDFGGRRARRNDRRESMGAAGEPAAETDEEKEEREMAEAMIFGEYRERARGRTDRKGLCTLAMLEGASISLEVKARGYATFLQAPFIPPTSATENDEEIEIRLYGGGSLHVYVADTTGAPAIDARVECVRDLGEREIKKGEKTDENGIALLEHLAVGTWKIRAFRPDNSIFAEGGRGSALHPAEWEEVEVVRGTESTIELTVPALGDLTGAVYLGTSPAPDARVSLAPADEVDRAEMMLEIQDQFAGINQDSRTGITDFEGRFTLTDLVPGDYVLLTRHPDVAMVTRTDVTIEIGDNDAEVSISTTSVEGRVIDDAGRPVAGARVSVNRHSDAEGAAERRLARQFLSSNSEPNAITDVDGHYRVLGITADTDLEVAVSADGYADAHEGPVRVTDGEVRSLPAIEVERAGAITITARDGSLGSGATPGVAFVRAVAKGGRALRDEAADKVGLMRGGRAHLDGLLAGEWEITLQAPSSDGELTTLGPETVEIKSGETAELEM
ncbi:MAG: carboxypeptidase-like regulatory domain-containing protein [Planctomycetota bacterium]